MNNRIVLHFTLLSFLCFCNGNLFSNEDQIIRISKDVFADDQSSIHQQDEWKFRYFPFSPKESPQEHPNFADRHDMYNVNPTCDDAVTNLTLDFDGTVENYQCSKIPFQVDPSIQPILHSDKIPPGYSAPHFCMHLKIEYPDPLVTFGGHRPHWGRYGEYSFIPRQRWMHNNEHGAVIMLYHPCANPVQVDHLRTLVTSCLFRHIITPYNLLSKERPLALITWGWYLNMNTVNSQLVRQFIIEHARQAPEDVEKEGKYDKHLIKPAKVVSDRQDSELCPSFSMK